MEMKIENLLFYISIKLMIIDFFSGNDHGQKGIHGDGSRISWL